jgi:hypothetical protein
MKWPPPPFEDLEELFTVRRTDSSKSALFEEDVEEETIRVPRVGRGSLSSSNATLSELGLDGFRERKSRV